MATNRDLAVDRKARLLIVDDTPTNLAVLERILRDDYDLVKAMHGREALAAVERCRFDLVLLDVMMPEIDGFEVFRRMKLAPRFRDTPVIFLTANTDTAYQREGLALGAADYLTKPFQRDNILLRIRNLLQRRRLQNRLELAMANSSLGFWSWEPLSGQLAIDSGGNPELALDIPRHSPGGRDWSALCHGEDLERLRATLAGQPARVDLDVRLRMANGDWRWFNLIGRSTDEVEDGEPLRLAGTFRDIDDRKREEIARFTSEERLRHVMAANDKGIWDWDMVGNTLLLGEGCRKILGLPADAPLERQGLDFFLEHLPTDWQPVFLNAIRQLNEPGNNHLQLEHQMQHASGRLLWISNQANVVSRDAGGRPQRLVGSFSDATERLEAITRIISLMGQLDAILTLSPDGIVYFDAEQRIAHVNRSCERLIGHPAGQLAQLSVAGFVDLLRAQADPLEPFPDLSGLIAVVDGGDRIIKLDRPDYRVLHLHWQTTRDGKTMALYLRDITQETEVDRMKSKFLTTAAHELRTPMASIMGFAELLLARDYAPEKTRELLGTIHRQACRLTQLIGELLDLARIESRGGQDFRFVRQPLLPVLRDALATLEFDQALTPLTLNPPAFALPDLAFDADRLQQAVINVLSNARKYSPAGGAIEVSLYRRETGDGPQLGICVRDQGIGMTREQLSRIFERFYRADPAQTIPGTGLGMSLVREIMDLHGGSVDIESEYGVGTTVVLWLPLDRQVDGQGAAGGPGHGDKPADDAVTLWLEP